MADGVPLDLGAPWAEAYSAPIVLIVSTRRGASTELAELIGNHPCGASFNELLQHSHFPAGYKYVNAGWKMRGYKDFLNVSSLRKSSWLDDARHVRARFCRSRPATVVNVCGDTCTVSLKMHLDTFVTTVADPDWLRLVTAKDVRAVVVQRDALENYCSIRKSTATHDWGHTPAAHMDNVGKQASWKLTSKCDLSSQAARHFGATVPARFNATRTALAAAGRPFMELPFSQYIANSSRAGARVLAFCGLRQPPSSWQGACCLPWCKTCDWPVASGSTLNRSSTAPGEQKRAESYS